ncbi:MAG TPA: restriction endonuclease subunit S [Ruminococcus sp.]
MDTKALRQKILDLAIRGKLVPQDPNDEPASVLLERIRAEKQQMVKDGKLKPKDIKNDTIIFKGEDNLHYEKFPDGSMKCIEDEIPFELPQGWEWCRLGIVFSHNTGKALNKSNTNGKLLSYITTSNVYWDRFELDNLKNMHFTDTELEKCTVKKGDLLVCEGGDIGRAAIWNYDYDICIQNHIHRLRPYANVNIVLYYHIFYYYKLIGMINGKGIGIQGLSSNQLHSIPIPLPPLQEQHRIVIKLKELISFIDTIESDKADLQSTIQLTKSKILDLAIRGKLVPQDPNDEPASVLLERIRTEKEELIKQGKIKRDKKESVIFRGDDNSYYEKIGDEVRCIDNELPYNIPENWAWKRLSSACIINPKNSIADDTVVSFVPMALIQDGYTNEFTFEQRKWGEVKKGFTHFAENDVGFAKITPCFENRKSVVFRGLCNGYGAGTTELYILRTLPDTILPEYILYVIKTDSFLVGGKQTCAGVVGQQRISKDYVCDYLVPVPPLNEQVRIIKKCTEIMTMLHNIEKSLS